MSETTAPTTRKQTALMKRLARMRDHKDFPRAMEHVPPAEEDLERADRRRRRGLVAVVLAGLIGLGAASSSTIGMIAWGAVSVIVAGLGLRELFGGAAERSTVLKDPLERRPALVADRRSETEAGWMGGRTTYYFQLEFDDGTNGEFRYPGRGVQDDLLVKGMTGVAFLRGRTLIAWKSIKV
jgi:hypothetical protein